MIMLKVFFFSYITQNGLLIVLLHATTFFFCYMLSERLRKKNKILSMVNYIVLILQKLHIKLHINIFLLKLSRKYISLFKFERNDYTSSDTITQKNICKRSFISRNSQNNYYQQTQFVFIIFFFISFCVWQNIELYTHGRKFQSCVFV